MERFNESKEFKKTIEDDWMVYYTLCVHDGLTHEQAVEETNLYIKIKNEELENEKE